MFPHMYKVRPGKVQQVKEPGMATDYQRQRGENWRRNSNKWGSQGWEANNSSGTPSSMQTPPAIPAPPPDPQDNLARNTPSPVFAYEKEKSTKQKFWWEDDYESDSVMDDCVHKTTIESDEYQTNDFNTYLNCDNDQKVIENTEQYQPPEYHQNGPGVFPYTEPITSYKETERGFRESNYEETEREFSESNYNETERELGESNYNETESELRENNYDETEIEFSESNYSETRRDLRENNYNETERELRENNYDETEREFSESNYNETERDLRESNYNETERDLRKSNYDETEIEFRESNYNETEREYRESNYDDFDAEGFWNNDNRSDEIKDSSLPWCKSPLTRSRSREISAEYEKQASVSPLPTRSRVRLHNSNQKEPPTNEISTPIENSYPPPVSSSSTGRSRTRQRQAQATENEAEDQNSYSSSFRRSRSRNNEPGKEESVNENCYPPPASPSVRVRSRARQRSEDNQNDNEATTNNSYPPPVRTRSRTRPVEPESSSSEVHYPPTVRRRSRSRAMSEETANVAPYVSSHPTPDVSQPTKHDPSVIENEGPDVTEMVSIPPSGRTRSRSRSNITVEESPAGESSPVAVRSRSRSRMGDHETPSCDDSNDVSSTSTVTLPLRRRVRRREENTEIQGEEQEPVKSRVRSRSRVQNLQEIESAASEGDCRTPTPEIPKSSETEEPTTRVRTRSRVRSSEPEDIQGGQKEVSKDDQEEQTKVSEDSQEEQAKVLENSSPVRQRTRSRSRIETPEKDESLASQTSRPSLRNRSASPDVVLRTDGEDQAPLNHSPPTVMLQDEEERPPMEDLQEGNIHVSPTYEEEAPQPPQSQPLYEEDQFEDKTITDHEQLKTECAVVKDDPFEDKIVTDQEQLNLDWPNCEVIQEDDRQGVVEDSRSSLHSPTPFHRRRSQELDPNYQTPTPEAQFPVEMTQNDMVNDLDEVEMSEPTENELGRKGRSRSLEVVPSELDTVHIEVQPSTPIDDERITFSTKDDTDIGTENKREWWEHPDTQAVEDDEHQQQQQEDGSEPIQDYDLMRGSEVFEEETQVAEDPDLVVVDNFWGVDDADVEPAAPEPQIDSQDEFWFEEAKQEANEEETKAEEDKVGDEEEAEDDENELANATRLWILSQSKDKELVDMVLPQIEDEILNCKVTTPKVKEKNWWEAESDEEPNLKPTKYIEEWNEQPGDEQEPKSFTSFTSIKLKSKPPKSPSDKLKREKVQLNDESSEIPIPPPPPPPPPPGLPGGKVPPPPPPPKSQQPMSGREKNLKKARERMVDNIKKAARSRPDWNSVMKDIEGGIKLRKVSSGEKLDRSKPILPKSRGKGGKFFYESEKPMVQNQLLGEIQRGVKLRHVKTNDRSRPDFNRLGLRKLRRQLTKEEKKTIDPDGPEALPSSSDEEEDIDQMRDDLSATKSQLADEIKKNKKMETEQKILKIDLQSLQAEVKKLKRKLKEAGIHDVKPLTNGEAEALAPKLSKSMSKLRMMEDEVDFSELDVIEEDIKLLNDQIEAQKKRAEKAELKCDEMAQKLILSQNSSEEWEMRSVYFEKKYKALQKDQGIELPEIDCTGTQTDPIEISPTKSESASALHTKKSGSRRSFASISRMQSFKEEDSEEESSSSEEEDTLSEHMDDEEEEEDGEECESEEEENKGTQTNDVEKREERDFIMWKNRLSHVKDKVKNVRKERNNLRDRVTKYYKDMRKERQEYLKLKKELKELSDQMKDSEEVKRFDDDDEGELSYEEEDEEEEEEEEEEEIDEGAPAWWREEVKQKPKKLRKRRKRETKKQQTADDEDEDIVDMTGLEDPQWTESEPEDSEDDDEDLDTTVRIKNLKETTRNLEENMNEKKKQTYMLKAQLDRCDEMNAEEKRRHDRLQNELHMLLADI